jgi:DNA topoisomerase VI subunit B
MPHTLEREWFETKRQLEYFSGKELSMQLGAPPRRWGVVLLKELVDNALDACETAQIAPEIRLTLTPDGLTVVDNGPGMLPALIERSLDYDIRVSDKSYYVSPSRGQLGNALKCLWAAPYAIDPDHPGSVEVVSRGVQHRIAVTVDRIAQEPRLQHLASDAPSCRNGTSITLIAPKIACYHAWEEIDDFYKPAQDLIDTYAAFNPHATFQLKTPGLTLDYPATTPVWQKWLPSHKTSPFWYELDHFMALIAAYLNRERALGRQGKTIRAFVSEFDGLSTSAKQKAVLQIAGLSRGYLRDLVQDEYLSDAAVEQLLRAMQAEARPVNPKKLGVLGREHLLAVLCQRHQVDPQRFWYKRVWGEASKLPCVLEVAFGVYRRGSGETSRRILAGINWSATPPPSQPFQRLEALLNTALVPEHAPVVVLVHLAIPRPTFRDRAKQALALPGSVEGSLEASLQSVTQRWTVAQKRTYRSRRADARAEEELLRQERARYPSLKEAAYRLMAEAYLAASGQGRYVAHARQIMYAARPQILAMIHPDKALKGLNAQYFTQTLVPDYMNEHPDETAGWDVVFDDRGHFREPHLQNGRERIIGLGTLAVRQYIASWQGTVSETIEHIFLPFDLRTSGPTHRYQSVLFVEKEGFDELIQQAQIAERFDIAPMSTKGMSNTAARRLVDALSQLGVTIYALHDFDKSGFSILHTLRTDTRRYRFQSTPKVIDLGLTLADVHTMALQSEPVNYRQAADPKIDLARCGATAEEQAFLITGGVSAMHPPGNITGLANASS